MILQYLELVTYILRPILDQWTTTRIRRAALLRPPSPSSSLSSRTQPAANRNATMLVYTGAARLKRSKTPPSIGAVIPPLENR